MGTREVLFFFFRAIIIHMALSVGECPLILLAAGRSSRMGTPKGLLSWQGRLWIVNQLHGFREAGGREATVVLGFHREAYEESLPWLKAAVHRPVREEGLEVTAVVNPDPERGPFSSLQCAASVIVWKPAVFVLPLDVPCPEKEVWEKLTEIFRPPLSAVIPRYQNRGGTSGSSFRGVS